MQIRFTDGTWVRFYHQSGNNWGFTARGADGKKYQLLGFPSLDAAWTDFYANKH